MAYILHTRQYRETSMLAEIFSSVHGRVSALAKGAFRGKPKLSTNLQPFMSVNVSWYGNGDLVVLTGAESTCPTPRLSGRNAICGLYINELIIKLLPKWDNCNILFAAYTEAIEELSIGHVLDQVVLRKFEMQLLKSLGYGLQLHFDVGTGAKISSNNYYVFDPELGPKLSASMNPNAIRGTSLLALAQEKWHSPGVLPDIKRLMRIVLSHHLGTRKLVSRELL